MSQVALIAEKADLDSKIGRLDAFMGSDEFPGLSDTQKTLLTKQRQAMLAYSHILAERIAA